MMTSYETAYLASFTYPMANRFDSLALFEQYDPDMDSKSAIAEPVEVASENLYLAPR